MNIEAICSLSPVIPVVEIEDAALTKPLCEALLAGGIGVIEITLRTPAALAAIEMAANVDGMVVGAGTLLNAEDVKNAEQAGAQFGVSPGSTPALINAAREHDFPFLPGAITPSEVTLLHDEGFSVLKFFPAQAAGGAPMLKGFAGPFGGVRFCPTGGINQTNTADFLALPNVICVGGSWVASRELINHQDWAQITANARSARAFA